MIHPSSIVSPNAQIGVDVEIGPFCTVADNVVVGDRTRLMSHVVLDNGARIGDDVVLHPGAVIGTAPQDLKYAGEETLAIVGNRTVVRECVTVNRGTSSTGKAEVGEDCLLMAYSHVAHDCIVGNHVILANAVQLGGHVVVGDWAIIGGVTGVHQFVRIGEHAMVGACTKAAKDVPPFTLASREPIVVEGVNAVGLRRRGFTQQTIAAIESFYTVLLFQGFNTTDGIAEYEQRTPVIDPAVVRAIDFIRNSKRGIYRGASRL